MYIFVASPERDRGVRCRGRPLRPKLVPAGDLSLTPNLFHFCDRRSGFVSCMCPSEGSEAHEGVHCQLCPRTDPSDWVWSEFSAFFVVLCPHRVGPVYHSGYFFLHAAPCLPYFPPPFFYFPAPRHPRSQLQPIFSRMSSSHFLLPIPKMIPAFPGDRGFRFCRPRVCEVTLNRFRRRTPSSPTLYFCCAIQSESK